MPLILALLPPIALAAVFIESTYDDDDSCCYHDEDNVIMRIFSALCCVPCVFAIGFIGSAIVLALFLVPGMIFQTYRLFKLIFYRCSCCLK